MRILILALLLISCTKEKTSDYTGDCLLVTYSTGYVVGYGRALKCNDFACHIALNNGYFVTVDRLDFKEADESNCKE